MKKNVTRKKIDTHEFRIILPLINKKCLSHLPVFDMKLVFKEQHGIFQRKYNMAYYERVADYEIFSYRFLRIVM